MNVWKKISALTFVLALALALSVSAFASTAETLTDGKVSGAKKMTEVEQGETSEFTGTFESLKRIVTLKKEIVVYNANDHVKTDEENNKSADGKVKAPEFSYTYTVKPVDTKQTVTDGEVTVKTKAGIIPGLKVGATGTQADAGATSITGTLAFTTENSFMANAEGATNTYGISLDFTGVTFTQSGVYRYEIEETLTKATVGGNEVAVTYDNLAMEDGELNKVYLDVYVDGSGAIYGYVCLPTDTAVVAKDDEHSISETTKIDGFVATATDAQKRTGDNTKDTSGADYYYTYDLTLRKTVTNDNYAASHIAFPFTVFFKPDADNMNAENVKFLVVEDIDQGATVQEGDTTKTTGITSVDSASAKGWSGVAKIRSGSSITYTGIPCGMDVTVYETNIMDGVTYKVTTKTTKVGAKSTDGEVDKYTNVTDPSVTSTKTEPTTAEDPITVGGNTSEANKLIAEAQSTQVKFDTTIASKVEVAQSCAIDNALINISPTGVTLRYAPYLLTLGAGVTVLPLTRRYKKREEDLV